MDTLNPNDSLNLQISMLEQKRAAEFRKLKEQLHETGKSLKPANLIKGALRDITGSSQVKSVLIKAGIGLVLGFAAQKLIASRKESKKTRIAGNILQYGITMLAANRPSFIQSAGVFVARNIFEAIKKRRQRRIQLRNIE